MNILYLGYFCNDKLFDALVAKGSMGSHARQQLEKKLLNGIIENVGNKSIKMVSYLPDIKSIHRKAGKGENYCGTEIRYLWCKKNRIISVFCAIIKNIFFIQKWAKCSDKKVILTYSTNPIHIIPALLLRRLCKYKVVTICSEVSIYRRTDNFSFAGKVSRSISSFLENSFDGYILLTKYMNEIVNKGGKPYIVVEGIAQEFPESENNKKFDAVLYAGGLTEDNGIEILLESFLKQEKLNIELWLCGDGPLKNLVTECALKCSKIKYYGVLSNDAVQKLEQKARLLIAPRFSTNDMTKYSFPSKTIEYMCSGTPTIITRLKGIPEEYFQYTYVLENETADGIYNLLQSIFLENEQTVREKGLAAREFVLKNKNYLVQSNRIISFIINI